MNETLNTFLYQGNEEMERSLLKGVLLFNSKDKAPSRKALLQKTIFSIVLQGEGKYTPDQIASIFKAHFQKTIEETEINSILSTLKKDGYLEKNGNPISKAGGEDFFQSLTKETDSLFMSIITKTGQYTGGSVSDIPRVKENIRKALSVYFKMYVFSFFDMQEDVIEDNAKAVLDAAMYGIDKRVGEGLVRALAFTLKSPTPEEELILEKWARAHVTMQIIGLDPTLQNFQATKMKGKEFILDTDIVIRCLAKTNSEHDLYLAMLKKLRELQCRLVLTEEVIKEVENHLEAAFNCYRKYGDTLLTYSQELLRSGIKNVFIEDYVTLKTSGSFYRDLDFTQYLRNLYDKSNPKYLRGLLCNLVGEKNFKNQFSVHVSDQERESLYKCILPLTENTFKGYNSSDERNKEISRVDAFLYLATIARNKETNGDSLLSRKAYLLTRSRRAAKAAKNAGLFQKGMICHPNALISILKETGSPDMRNVSIVNLFSNPFLVYVGREMWSFIKPFLDHNARLIKHSITERLRTDVDLLMDSRLTNGVDSLTKEQRQDLGIYYPDELEGLQSERDNLRNTVQNQDELIAQKNEEIRKLQNQLNEEKKKKARNGSAQAVSHRSKKRKR
jgi:hypothetical protein